MKGQLRTLVRSFRNNELVWRYGFNFASSMEYAIEGRKSLSAVEMRAVGDLNRDGIARTSVEDLFPGEAEFEELRCAAEEMLEARKDEIEIIETEAADSTKIGRKTFNLQLLGSELTFDPRDIFSRFAISPALLNIANAYLRMHTQLRYYNVWYTFATDSEARESQLWHFDREDNYILKVFVYLRDVEIGAGPFTYARGTHRKGLHWNRKPESFTEGNVQRTTDEQMNVVIPREEWITATGEKGTVVFADTRGYHKGGEARDANRLMYTCMFTSPASDSKRLLAYHPSDLNQRLSRDQRIALEI